jgi:PII-like signaling protein
MKLEGEQVLCRFYLTSVDRVGLQPSYEAIVETARREHLAGATVLKGCMGFSLGGPMLEEHAWTLSNPVPIIVEIVDSQTQIIRLLGEVAPRVHSGMVTLERAHVLYYRGGTEQGATVAMDTAPQEALPMQIPEEGVLLRIFIGESDVDSRSSRPLYEALVYRAKEMHLAGATVLRGPMGFGKHSRLHTSKLVDLSRDLPIVIEIVDSEPKIQSFLPIVDESVTEGLVTMEKVRVLKYVAEAGRDA